MERLSTTGYRALAIALLGVLGVAAHAQSVQVNGGDVDVDTPRTRVRVDTPSEPVPPPEPGAPVEPTPPAPPAQPSFWIGILGGEVEPALRSHLGLEGAGVLVREVVEESPAAKAGIREHDVLLTANGEPIADMSDLAMVVGAAGNEGGEITVELVRAGAEHQVVVAPEQRPTRPVSGGPSVPGDPADPFARVRDPFNFRLFGPGVPLGVGDIDVQGPGGTSVSVRTENGKTRVEVTQGEQSWVVDGADPESLEKLPPEVRPTVESLLAGRGLDLDIDVEGMMPRLQEMFGNLRARRADRQRERLESLERQVAELRARLGMEPAAPAAGDEAPGAEALEEAPPFNPDAPPAEIEIPSVDEE